MVKKYGIYIIVLVLIAVSSMMIFSKLNPKELPSNLITATGSIDGDLIALNTKYSGRIERIDIEDGQRVKINDILAVLKSDEYKEKLRALNESIQSAIYGLKAMQEELSMAKESIPLNIKKALKTVDIAKNKQKQLHSAIDTLNALVQQDELDFKRDTTLYNKNLISKQKFEYEQLKLTTDINQLQALNTQLLEASKMIELANYDYQLALAQEKKILVLEANRDSVKSNIESLKANRAELQVVIDELIIKSPIEGYVIEKIANKGEVVSSGMVVATLIEPNSLYLKVFVDTMNNGKINVGDDAVIFLDAYSDKPLKAKVSSIAANAEFTPKEVAVRSDRIQRVYAVHLKPLKIEPLLKLGIPAIGVISIDGKGLPSSLSDIPSI